MIIIEDLSKRGRQVNGQKGISAKKSVCRGEEKKPNWRPRLKKRRTGMVFKMSSTEGGGNIVSQARRVDGKQRDKPYSNRRKDSRGSKTLS